MGFWLVLAEEQRELTVVPGAHVVVRIPVTIGVENLVVVQLGANKDQTGHTHLNVLDVLEVTVVHERTCIVWTVVVHHGLTDRHRG